MPRQSRPSAFDAKLTLEQQQQLAIDLCDEIQKAFDARGTQDREIDYWHQLYEQARTRHGSSMPWPGAADLTSYLGTQNVDALHARLMKTVWVEPIWTVEGWGSSAERAPFVEEFHQWKAEDERLQHVLDRWALNALIEPRGLLEVYEGTETRPVRREIWAKLLLQPTVNPQTGMPEMAPVFDAKGQPQLERQGGRYVEAEDEQTPSAKIEVDSTEPVRSGPQYRVLPYQDSLIFPGHARDRDEIWGFGKRFWRRIPELEAGAARGDYDADAVARLTRTSEREPTATLERSGQSIPTQEGASVEKELWELLILRDIDGKGERWYLVTVNLPQQVLLRCKYDPLALPRYIPVILFPRSDRVTEGFSLIGHKLITTIEEHTAVRNMRADRSSLAVQAPIKRLRGALWHPQEQPFGPNQTIDVSDMREVEQMTITDVPNSVIDWERGLERIAERLVGVNDIASGQTVQDSKTLGEVQMATEQSFVRMDLVIRRFQEAMEDLFQVRHEIWKRTLADPTAPPMEMPSGMQQTLMARGMNLPTAVVTADMLDGKFRGKPRGNVETADPRAQRSDFTQALQSFPALLQAFPLLQMVFMQNPLAAKAMLEQFVRVYRIPNRQAFIGAAMQMGMAPPMPGMAPMLPGAPPMPGQIPMAPGPAQVQ